MTTDSGRVTGVRLADGTELPAEIVVSDIDPRDLYGQLVDDPAAKKVRARFCRPTRRRPRTSSTWA